MDWERVRRNAPRLNIAPLIDCVLLLIIFFMLTSQFVMPPGFKIALPTAKCARPEEGRIVVHLPREGGIYVDGKPVEEKDLFSKLRQAVERDSVRTLIIQADREISLGRVVRIMDEGKRAGVERMTLATQKEN